LLPAALLPVLVEALLPNTLLFFGEKSGSEKTGKAGMSVKALEPI
jgi:hypothetical protein